MAITALPPVPSRSDPPATFIAKADAFLAALPQFQAEANAQAVALSLNSTNDTSTSSVLIGVGAKSFTVSAGKSYQSGMFLIIADTAAPATNWMYGQVTSYSGTALAMNITQIGGSGTKTAWVISQSVGGGNVSGLQNLSTGANIASAATVDLTAATGNTVDITGTVATTAITMNAGQIMWLIPQGAWPLTHHATNLNLPGGVNYTCAAGDRILVIKDLAGVTYLTPWRADGTAVVAAAASILVKTRQTILQQAAAPLVIGTGLAVNLAATATSYRVTVPNGVGANGNIDFMVNRTADVTGYWSGLTASVINYLFVDRNSSTGVDTGVASSLPYIAQAGGTISVVSGQHTYDYSTGTMYVGNGSVATAVQRTAVGQCLAGAASITTVTPYAIGRIYDSGYTATLPIVAARTTKVSNLGVEGEHELTIKCTTADLNFAVGETLSWRSGGGWNGAFIQPGVGSSRLEVWMHLGTGNSFAPIPGAGGTSGTLLTAASWSYKLTHKTPWN